MKVRASFDANRHGWSRPQVWGEWVGEDEFGYSLAWGTPGADPVWSVYVDIHPPRWFVARSLRKSMERDPEGTRQWLNVVRRWSAGAQQ